MQRWLTAFVILGLASVLPAKEPKQTYIRHGQTYCAKHHIPTISVMGYRPYETPGDLVLVHDYNPHVDKCWPESPNRLPDDRSFDRTSIHTVRGIITFCPLCDADYRRCYGGDRQLSDIDLAQITSLVARHPEFHRPILRMFAVGKPNAIAIGGHQGRVDDLFSDMVFEKHDGRWMVAHPASSHRIVAVGRDYYK